MKTSKYFFMLPHFFLVTILIGLGNQTRLYRYTSSPALNGGMYSLVSISFRAYFLPQKRLTSRDGTGQFGPYFVQLL